MAPGNIPVDPFREIVLQRVAEGWQLTHIALDAGFVNRKRGGYAGDATRLKRAVGLVGNTGGREGKLYPPQRMITYETAARVVKACGFDPVDFDI